MKTPFDDAVGKLVILANEGFSRGWDRLDWADKIDEIGNAVGDVHAEWMTLTMERDFLRAIIAKIAIRTNGYWNAAIGTGSDEEKLDNAEAALHEIANALGEPF